MEDVGTRRRIFLSLSELGCCPQKFNSWEIHLRWPIFKSFGINAAVAVVVAKSSIFTERVVFISYLFILLIHFCFFWEIYTPYSMV